MMIKCYCLVLNSEQALCAAVCASRVAESEQGVDLLKLQRRPLTIFAETTFNAPARMSGWTLACALLFVSLFVARCCISTHRFLAELTRINQNRPSLPVLAYAFFFNIKERKKDGIKDFSGAYMLATQINRHAKTFMTMGADLRGTRKKKRGHLDTNWPAGLNFCVSSFIVRL